MRSSLPNYQLLTNQIDIWQFSLVSEPEQAFALLNEEEQIRARRFHFDRHQRRFIVARAMMRTILARYLNTSPAELEFLFNKQGKPYLIHALQPEFNLSHSKDTALLAVGCSKPLGIDLEFFSARPYEDIGAQLFSADEMTALRRLPSRLKALGFFHIWAQKEAFIKACGLGLSYPTMDFTVPVLPTSNLQIEDKLNKCNRQLISFMPFLACSAALCHDPMVTTVHKYYADPLSFLSQRA